MAKLQIARDVPPPVGGIDGARMRELAETFASISLWHLCPATRELLRRNALSVNAYPTEFGGLVFVGSPRQRIPVERDLNGVTELAERAGIAWLLFDIEAPVIDDLPVFDPVESDH